MVGVPHPQHDGGGDEAVDTENVPAAVFEPTAKPSQRHEAGEKCKDRTEDAGRDGRREHEPDMRMLSLVEPQKLASNG